MKGAIMAKGLKVCKVCGKEYEGCYTQRPNLDNEFRWQEVACCPEHGAEYLRQIMISRGELQPEAVEEGTPIQAETRTRKRDGKKSKVAETEQ